MPNIRQSMAAALPSPRATTSVAPFGTRFSAEGSPPNVVTPCELAEQKPSANASAGSGFRGLTGSESAARAC